MKLSSRGHVFMLGCRGATVEKHKNKSKQFASDISSRYDLLKREKKKHPTQQSSEWKKHGIRLESTFKRYFEPVNNSVASYYTGLKYCLNINFDTVLVSLACCVACLSFCVFINLYCMHQFP